MKSIVSMDRIIDNRDSLFLQTKSSEKGRDEYSTTMLCRSLTFAGSSFRPLRKASHAFS
ncbi:hypothetical protein BAE44_0017512 [Dichanthelium oligosanthes]|uniref:Uncharacterized protein n=1 Tax=Dichanthelium oligosanthes TaxID=888268 RepID=A0A1E5V8I8_9POAL|nr:hypothetical protein BAE44_0017512 [Dichanthelium oligosanthes]